MDWKKPEFVPHFSLKILFFLAVCLSTVMTILSEYNRHPDEIHHFLAARYYTNHFLPPEIGDESVRETYSVYGVSYLNYHWTEYFLAGKFSAVTEPIFGSPLLSVRMFNVFLFLVTGLLFAFRGKGESFAIASLLIASPQIWYVFSYSNNDAFALFISLLMAYQLASERGSLRGFLSSDDFRTKLRGGVLFGLLTGILLTCKTNYYPFVLFSGLWLLLSFPPKTIVGFKKFGIIALTAVLFFSFRIGMDFYVNGETNFVGISYLSYFSGNFEARKNKLLAYQEEIAEKPYKPSTIENDLDATDRALKLKAKGLGFSELFTVWNWHDISFKSFTGVYGYMNVFGSDKYYLAMKVLFVLFGIYLVAAAFFPGGSGGAWRSAAAVVCAAVTIFISAYLSWSYAFQAQGRYLFPMIGIAGVLLHSQRSAYRNAVVHVFLWIAFALSAYSFIGVGIARINS